MFFRKSAEPPSDEQIENIVRQARKLAEDGEGADVLAALLPLREVQARHAKSAGALIDFVETGDLVCDDALPILADIHAAHAHDPSMLSAIGAVLERARDIDLLNDPPPEHPLFAAVTTELAALAQRSKGTENEPAILEGLRTASRMVARQYDELCDASCRRMIELEPQRARNHYNYGLFLKTRGRFREGMLENQRAASLVTEPVESYEWNTGICATGAREAEVALQVWQRMGNKLRIGRFGLPEGGYATVKVRLAERPLAERTADHDDPGLEETIWIERLSPCHGVVRSVLYQDLGVDYGDVVLFDGAPITYHTIGDKKVPVFPHLATLVRSGYQRFDFAGTQDGAGRLADVTDALERDAVVYSHSESFVTLCAACWRNQDIEHKHGAGEERRVIAGRIAAPPDYDPRELLRQLDAALEQRAPNKIFSPALCEAAGQHERALFERSRFDMLLQRDGEADA